MYCAASLSSGEAEGRGPNSCDNQPRCAMALSVSRWTLSPPVCALASEEGVGMGLGVDVGVDVGVVVGLRTQATDTTDTTARMVRTIAR